MVGNLFKFNEYIKEIKNDKNISIVIGLFTLIGFIILVYSIFIIIFREPFTLVANIVVVGIIIGSFAVVGIILGERNIK